MIVGRYCYARKFGATIERRRADARYTVANRYARKFGATIERIITDARYTIRDCYARKAGAIIERTVKNIAACYRNRFKCRRDVVRSACS